MAVTGLAAKAVGVGLAKACGTATGGSCQVPNAAIAAWVDGEVARSGSVENGDTAAVGDGAEKGEGAAGEGAEGVSKGALEYAGGVASNPKLSGGSTA